MNGVTQPVGPPRLLVMFGRKALLVAVPERSQAAADGSAFTTEYGMRVSTTANSEVRKATPIDYDLGAHSLNEVRTE
jgi:hypothetical protein